MSIVMHYKPAEYLKYKINYKSIIINIRIILLNYKMSEGN